MSAQLSKRLGWPSWQNLIQHDNVYQCDNGCGVTGCVLYPKHSSLCPSILKNTPLPCSPILLDNKMDHRPRYQKSLPDSGGEARSENTALQHFVERKALGISHSASPEVRITTGGSAVPLYHHRVLLRG